MGIINDNFNEYVNVRFNGDVPDQLFQPVREAFVLGFSACYNYMIRDVAAGSEEEADEKMSRMGKDLRKNLANLLTKHLIEKLKNENN
jgi:hypothetical protein